MMYGFGDDEQPLAQSVAVAEDLVCEFLASVSTKAVQNCVANGGIRKGAFKVVVVLGALVFLWVSFVSIFSPAWLLCYHLR